MAGVLFAAGVYAVIRPKSTTQTGPESWPVGALPKHVYQTGRTDFEAVVAFQHLLTPTADPLVYLYHPGRPLAVAPATYEIHFADPPVFSAAPPVVVRGRVDRIAPDLVRRVNGVPGRLVLTSATPTRP